MRKLTTLMMTIVMLLCSLCLPALGEPAEAAENTSAIIPYRFATAEEGRELMLSNEEYFEGINANKIAYIMKNDSSTLEDYKAFCAEQVLEWTDAEKEMISRCMEKVEQAFIRNGWTMPPLETIVFIRTTMKEEGDAAGYTHGTQIYLTELLKHLAGLPPESVDTQIMTILAHEMFHCLTRCNPDFRKDMYSIIHFSVEEDDYKLPESVWEYYIANPDVEHHNAHATFMIDGKETECYAAFLTTKHFENEGDIFMAYGTTALVPVDGTDTWYTPEQASNFDEVFGTNTGYVIDPEECMADNFSFAVVYGDKGPEGNGYPNPEIIEAISGYLRGE